MSGVECDTEPAADDHVTWMGDNIVEQYTDDIADSSTVLGEDNVQCHVDQLEMPVVEGTANISSISLDHDSFTDDQYTSNIVNFVSPTTMIDVSDANHNNLNDDIADHFTVLGEDDNVQCEDVTFDAATIPTIHIEPHTGELTVSTVNDVPPQIPILDNAIADRFNAVDVSDNAQCEDYQLLTTKIANVVAGTISPMNLEHHTYTDGQPTLTDDNVAHQTLMLDNDIADCFSVLGVSDNVQCENGGQLTSKVAGVAAAAVSPIHLDHHIFTEDSWKKATSLKHPSVCVMIGTNESDYSSFGYRCPQIQRKQIVVVTDTGAMSCLWSREECFRCGFTRDDLIPVIHRMKSANSSPITIDGALPVRLTGVAEDGRVIEAAVMVYISPQARSFYLSREAMIQLGIIHHSFPQIGDADVPRSAVAGVQVDKSELAECGCLRRTKGCGMPNKLPFEAQKENVEAMKMWLLKRYASSVFNQCPHQLLPEMQGPPMKLHVNKDAEFVNFTTPVPVPIHWQDDNYKELMRDCKIGVLERHPLGVPVKACHRQVLIRKKNGKPRRAVDLSPTNKHCMRETYPTKSPFHLARAVPPASIKTVFDAWNGFHAVPLQEEDRYLTTFITPFGLFRHKRAPQGFVSSSDAYNRRFDEIVQHFIRLQRCVDDSLLHDQDMNEHWWRVIEFLELLANNGVVLNPEKIQFSQETVDFAGFRISLDTVEPLPKYLDAIREYPTPANISDIRSWFGLVNQVSHYAQLRDLMEPFRKFLSPKVKFEWTNELDALFNESKSQIISAIKEGVRIFDITKRTSLRTDWSKTGIGFWLLQKHCDCKQRSPGCCDDGWKITLASSRFLSSAERNYAAVEGEALAVAWGLEQTRYFTLGCDDLLVVVDHKPLVKLLGDRRLDEITNPRLLRLKQRTLMWKFEIEYQPGNLNTTSDALSRYPNKYAEVASICMQTEGDQDEEFIIGAICNEMYHAVAVTTEQVKSSTKTDSVLQKVMKYVINGFPSTKKAMDVDTREYWEYRHCLNVADDMLLYDDRIVIPNELRGQVLMNLHAAHQGTSGMMARCNISMFWPGYTTDITRTREMCRQCHTNSPSQPKLPPVTDRKTPKVPFEMIFSDYFQLCGHHYLIIGDRLSGWTEVIQIKPSTQSAGSKGLCTAFRRVFATFGVPEEVSSDGGPEFIAGETEHFFDKWGVTTHRRSSAYLPQSNGRAEVAVKTTKRLLECNVGRDGSLDTDKVVRALLMLRNTPDRECGLSPAQILFGHPLRDSLPYLSKNESVFHNPQIHNVWRSAWRAKESAIYNRSLRNNERLSEHCRSLSPVNDGDKVLIQNQDKGSKSCGKWDRYGEVIGSRDHDQYLVKLLGSGRLSLRNRRHLRRSPDSPVEKQSTVIPDVNFQPQTFDTPMESHTSSPNTPPPAEASPPHQADDTPCPFSPGTDTIIPADNTVPCPHEVHEPEEPTQEAWVRRSTRAQTKTRFYDAASGKGDVAHS